MAASRVLFASGLLVLPPPSAALLLSPRAVPNAARRAAPVRCQATGDLPPGWKEVTDSESGQPYYYNAASGVTQWQKPMETDRFAGAGDSTTRSLSPACTWRIKLGLTAAGTDATATITATVRFAEEDGYEPPQGSLRVESCAPEGALVLGEQKSQWLLSEDPEDRKDSLWIWGLFSEPLYPFLLCQLELAEPFTVSEGHVIPAGPLYFQVDHRRKDGGVQLGEGSVNYKVTEQLKADLVGLSDFTYGEPVPCGTVRFLDTADLVSKGSSLL